MFSTAALTGEQVHLGLIHFQPALFFKTGVEVAYEQFHCLLTLLAHKLLAERVFALCKFISQRRLLMFSDRNHGPGASQVQRAANLALLQIESLASSAAQGADFRNLRRTYNQLTGLHGCAHFFGSLAHIMLSMSAVGQF